MKKWLRWSLVLLFVGVFLFSGYQLGSYLWESHTQQQQFDELAQLVQQVTRPAIPLETQPTEPAQTVPFETQPPEPTEPQILAAYAEISQRNPDMAGWLIIENTRINYPVMHTPDRVDYYLHRDFYGQYSGHGCLYAREQCDINAPSDNITIYGHNMKDGSMFADLMNYSSKSFWEEHRYVHFDTLTAYHSYEVFAVFTTTASKGKGFAYHQFVNADDAADFAEFVAQCQSLSLYDTGITPVYGDKLITLSTCEYTQNNGRLVVVARQVN